MNNTPMITDWLMVGITAAYLIATVAIFLVNMKSAKATKEQIAESKRQYEDNKRIEVMPYIQFERVKTSKESEHIIRHVLTSSDEIEGSLNLLLSMKNIGNGTAKNIEYTYYWDNGKNSHDQGVFPVQALSSNEQHLIRFLFAFSKHATDDLYADFLFRYKDLLENEYTQRLRIKLDHPNTDSAKLSEISTTSPVYVEKERKNV